jgi:hypothetical protein
MSFRMSAGRSLGSAASQLSGRRPAVFSVRDTHDPLEIYREPGKFHLQSLEILHQDL